MRHYSLQYHDEKLKIATLAAMGFTPPVDRKNHFDPFSDLDWLHEYLIEILLIDYCVSIYFFHIFKIQGWARGISIRLLNSLR